MINVLILPLVIFLIYCVIKLSYINQNKNYLENFRSNIPSITRSDITNSIAGLLNISKRRIYDLNYTPKTKNGEIFKLAISFDLLPNNEIEQDEASNEKVIKLINELILSNSFLITSNEGERILLTKADIKDIEKKESFENNNGDDDKHTDNKELDKHIKYINENVRTGFPSNHNLERYYSIDYKTGNLIEPTALITIPEEEEKELQ